MSTLQGLICGIFIGGPKALHDSKGEWRSSIARDNVTGPVRLETRGFVGDQPTQPFHGSPDMAVCLHALAHYAFWNSHYSMSLKAGAVGENLTLDVLEDGNVCVGDVFQVGTARLQISGPRAPCETQARHIGRPDWVKLTLQELRTGFYARVLAPGTLQGGDAMDLEERPNPGLTVLELNRCCHHEFHVDIARAFMASAGLMDRWKRRLQARAQAGGVSL
jgi:MOSC domain-containing protein YiiM